MEEYKKSKFYLVCFRMCCIIFRHSYILWKNSLNGKIEKIILGGVWLWWRKLDAISTPKAHDLSSMIDCTNIVFSNWQSKGGEKYVISRGRFFLLCCCLCRNTELTQGSLQFELFCVACCVATMVVSI